MALPVSKIVFQMIALGLKNIVEIILRLPATSARANHQGNSGGCQLMASDESILVKHFAIGLTGESEFTQIDSQGGLGVSQGNLIDVAIAVNFFGTSAPKKFIAIATLIRYL